MHCATRPRLTTLMVLAAYLAAHTLGALLHERLHVHAAGDVCCHAHDHNHGHAYETEASTPEGNLASKGALHDHDCVVCRVTGQPVVPAVAADFDMVADVRPDALPCPAAAPRSLAVRIAQSRAPPLAV